MNIPPYLFSRFKSDKIEIDNTNQKFNDILKELTKKVQHWKREIAKLDLGDIPGEDREELRTFETEQDMEELANLDVDKWQAELNLLEENLAAQQPDLKV